MLEVKGKPFYSYSRGCIANVLSDPLTTLTKVESQIMPMATATYKDGLVCSRTMWIYIASNISYDCSWHFEPVPATM